MELGGQISAILGTGSAPRDGATPSPRQPPVLSLRDASTSIVRRKFRLLYAVTDDRHIGTAGPAREYNKEPSIKSPRRGGLRRRIAARHINHRNHAAGGVEAVIAGHGRGPGRHRIDSDAGDPASARSDQRRRSAGTAGQMRLRRSWVRIGRHIDRDRRRRHLGRAWTE